MSRLFCYGTLQVPEVIKAVTGRTYPKNPAVLAGYAIYKVKDTEYPGIIRARDRETAGLVYEDVSQNDLAVLDLFEGNFYTRKLLEVRFSDDDKAKAWVYVISDRHKDILTDEKWMLSDFVNDGLKRFMKGYVNARKNIYAGKRN